MHCTALFGLSRFVRATALAGQLRPAQAGSPPGLLKVPVSQSWHEGELRGSTRAYHGRYGREDSHAARRLALTTYATTSGWVA